jgi:hypothetical protein
MPGFNFIKLRQATEEFLYDKFNNSNAWGGHQLIKKKVYINKSEDMSEIIVSLPVQINKYMYSDICIKLLDIPAAAIKKIRIKSDNNFMSYDGYFYDLDWLTIYLYNIQHYPTFLPKKVFKLPNLIIDECPCVFEIVFERELLLKQYLEPNRLRIMSMLDAALELDVNLLVLEYIGYSIDIDIWGMTHKIQDIKRPLNSIFDISQYIHIQSKYINITNSYGEIEINIDINKNIEFAIFEKDNCDILHIFDKVKITYDDDTKSTIHDHDLDIFPIIVNDHYRNNHVVKKRFILMDEIMSKEHYPGVYSIDLEKIHGHSVTMRDYPVKSIKRFQFYLKPSKKSSYIYMQYM